MLTKEQYNEEINKMKTALGDNFGLVSSIVANLSTDYDSVLQAQTDNEAEKEKLKTDYEKQISDLKAEKIKLLETNNDLFSKVTNTSKPHTDSIIEEEISKNPTDINTIINDEGGLE